MGLAISIGGGFAGGGVQFGDALVESSTGSIWNLTDLDGWASPDVILSTSSPVNRGVVVGEHKYGGRPMTISGVIYTLSEAAQHEARRRVMSAFDLVGREVDLTVTGEAVTKTISVRLAGRIKEKIRSANLVEIEIPILAPDPRKYNTATYTLTLTIGGGTNNALGNLPKNGDAPTDLHIVITGPADAPTITTGAGLIWLTGTLGTGEVLTIDTKAKTIVKGSTSVYSWLHPTARWFELEGLSTNSSSTQLITYTRVTGYSQASTAVITYRDAWY